MIGAPGGSACSHRPRGRMARMGRLRGRLRYMRSVRQRRRHLASLPEGSAEPVTLIDADSSTLLVAFGGINRGVGMPLFEFKRITEPLGVKRLFVRDPRQAWYHR